MGTALLAAAAFLPAVSLLSRGPLALVRVLGPRLHQALDLVLVVGLALSPVFVLLAGGSIDVAGVIVAEAVAVIVLRLSLRTRYVPAPTPVAEQPAIDVREVQPPRPAPEPEQPVREATAPPAETSEPPAGERASSVPSTAWTLGVLTARARRRGVGNDRMLGDGARRLGTAFGRANRRRDQ